MDVSAQKTWNKKLIQHRTIRKRVLEQRIEFLNTHGLLSPPTAVCDDLYAHAINYNGNIASERMERVRRSWQRTACWWAISSKAEEFKKAVETFFDEEEQFIIQEIAESVQKHNVSLDSGHLSVQQADLRQSIEILKARALEEIEDLRLSKKRERAGWLRASGYVVLQALVALGVAYYTAVKTNELNQQEITAYRGQVEMLRTEFSRLTQEYSRLVRWQVKNTSEIDREIARLREDLPAQIESIKLQNQQRQAEISGEMLRRGLTGGSIEAARRRQADDEMKQEINALEKRVKREIEDMQDQKKRLLDKPK